VDSLNKPRTWIMLGVVGAVLFLLYQFWHWEVERVEVPPGEFLVVISLWGKELPPGEVIAPNESYKGIQLKPRLDGRHFINPLLYTYERQKSVTVPDGQCLVLTRKYGNEIDADKLKKRKILVEGDQTPLEWDEKSMSRSGERGIVRKPLNPGPTYYLNSHAYDWTLVPKVSIKTEQVGVRVLKVGEDPATLDKKQWTNLYLVPDGYRGVQEKPVVGKDYYVNPYAESITPVDVGSTTVRLTDIVFPSKDGFTLNPVVLVKYNVQPEMAPHLLVTLTDKGVLSQKSDTPEDQEKNQILQKVVLPLIRGSVRMEGSKFNARDFIAAQVKEPGADKLNPREILQKKLNEEIPKKCKMEGINIAMITIGEFNIHDDLVELATQINERKQAGLKLVSNQSKIKEYKAKQKLEADSEALTQQKGLVVEANTLLQNAKIEAEKRKSVAEKGLKNDLEIAEIRLAASQDNARGIQAKGEAEAKKLMLENEAEVAGLRKAISGFPGADAFAQFHIMAKLGPALTEIFASDTSEFAKLFASYLTSFSGRPANPTGTGSTGPMGNGTSGR